MKRDLYSLILGLELLWYRLDRSARSYLTWVTLVTGCKSQWTSLKAKTCYRLNLSLRSTSTCKCRMLFATKGSILGRSYSRNLAKLNKKATQLFLFLKRTIIHVKGWLNPSVISTTLKTKSFIRQSQGQSTQTSALIKKNTGSYSTFMRFKSLTS